MNGCRLIPKYDNDVNNEMYERDKRDSVEHDFEALEGIRIYRGVMHQIEAWDHFRFFGHRYNTNNDDDVFDLCRLFLEDFRQDRPVSCYLNYLETCDEFSCRVGPTLTSDGNDSSSANLLAKALSRIRELIADPNHPEWAGSLQNNISLQTVEVIPGSVVVETTTRVPTECTRIKFIDNRMLSSLLLPPGVWNELAQVLTDAFRGIEGTDPLRFPDTVDGTFRREMLGVRVGERALCIENSNSHSIFNFLCDAGDERDYDIR